MNVQTQVSTEVKTRKIFFQEHWGDFYTHFCTDKEFQAIMNQIRRKEAVVDLGDGKGFSFTQYKGHETLSPEEIKRMTKPRLISLASKIVREGRKEYEIKTMGLYDPRQKKILKEKTVKTFLHEYTEAEIKRHKKFTKAILDRHKTGKSFARILMEFFEKTPSNTSPITS